MNNFDFTEHIWASGTDKFPCDPTEVSRELKMLQIAVLTYLNLNWYIPCWNLGNLGKLNQLLIWEQVPDKKQWWHYHESWGPDCQLGLTLQFKVNHSNSVTFRYSQSHWEVTFRYRLNRQVRFKSLTMASSNNIHE